MASTPLVYMAISQELYENLYFGEALPRLEGAARVERWTGPGNPPLEVVQQAIQRAEVLVTGWGTPALAETLAGWSPASSPLRLLAHSAGSIRHLVTQETLERGLLVTHANESLAEAVAEFTFGAILAMRRQMFLCAERFKQGKPTPNFQTMNELSGSTVGIIGASAIGRRVMEMLRPWRVKILLFDPFISDAKAAQYQAERVEDLVELFRRSDIVSLHAPITPETIGMLRGEHFAAMKDGALFVNTARGVLVDHPALLETLQTGRISALLDVTDPTEPLPPDSPFLRMENCVVIHHQAGNSVQARQRQSRYTVDDILNWAAGRPLERGVQAEKMPIMA